MSEPATPAPTPTSSDYMLENTNERDRLYILFDLWRPDFHRSFDHALTLGDLSTDPATARWRLLDVCCGEGLVSADILERFPLARAVGFDRDAEAIASGSIAYAPLDRLRLY